MTLTESSLPEFREGQGYDINISAKHNWDINDTVLPVVCIFTSLFNLTMLLNASLSGIFIPNHNKLA